MNLSAMQVALLLGGVLGSLACAFYLGFFSGQKVGLEMALSNNLSAAMRLPIGGEDEELGDDLEGITDVYAKLRQIELPSGEFDEAVDFLPGKTAAALQAERDQAQRFESETGLADSKVEATAKASLQDDSDVAALSGGKTRSASLGSLTQNGADSKGQEESSGGVGAPAKSDRAGAPATLGTLVDDTAKREVAAPVAVVVEKKNSEVVARVPPPVEVATKREAVPEKKISASVASANVSGSLIRDRLPSGWFAQVGAPDNRSEAERVGRILQSSGFPVVIENAKVRGQEYFRILVGPEQTRQQAERLMGQLKRESSVKADPFIRMVR